MYNLRECKERTITQLNNILFYEGESGFVKNFRRIMIQSHCEEIETILKTKRMLNIIIKNNLFWSNFDLFEKRKYELCPLIRELSDENPSYFLKNYKEIIKHFDNDFFFGLILFYSEEINNGSYDLIKYLIENNVKCNYNLILRLYMKDLRNMKLIIENLDYFLKDNKNLIEAKTIMQDYGMDNAVYSYIDNNKDRVIKEIINKKLQLADEKIDSENVVDLVKGIAEELLGYQNLNFHDINYIGCGGFTAVYQIGDKVIKIGSKRNNFKIDDHRRFLKPIYRQEIKHINGKNTLLCIEVTELVDTKGIIEEDVYRIYKELREDGLIWGDAKVENLGILLKDNRVHFDNLEPSIEATGYRTKNDEVLEAGDIVITDNDYIYKVKDLEKVYKKDIHQIILDCFPSSVFLERKYQREVKKKEMVRK